MKTTIKFVNADLVNATVTLMVGTRQITVSSSEYKRLHDISKDWTSGLWFLTRHNGTTFTFNSNNAYGIKGQALVRIVESIINK